MVSTANLKKFWAKLKFKIIFRVFSPCYIFEVADDYFYDNLKIGDDGYTSHGSIRHKCIYIERYMVHKVKTIYIPFYYKGVPLKYTKGEERWKK